MTPEEVKQEVRALYLASRDLIGGDWIEDTDTWDWCRLPNGTGGAHYTLGSFRTGQPLPIPPDELAEKARDLWAKHGHTVTVEHDFTLTPHRYILSDPPWLTGTGPDRRLVRLSIGENLANFIADSRCIPGDSYEIGQAH
ncbi:hypothetical protein [Leifsonia poae]|uniref:hypothetical protein n=1 Tax=Leifsonia poae TaxID=110933 RepID=UPI001CBCC9AB|nr:hypothetical protein [Leifsonia poae]